MKLIKYLLIIIFVISFLKFPNLTNAQSCSGSITCCSSSSIRCEDSTGNSCSPGSSGCECEDVCDSWDISQTCRLNGSATGCQVSNGCGLAQGSCSYNPPPPTPAPTAPPPGSTPGPTAPPGWGSCGSCTAGGCITAHSRTSPGGCVCDPGGCSTPSAPPPFCSLTFSPSSAVIPLGEVQRFALTSNHSYCPGCAIDRQGSAGPVGRVTPASFSYPNNTRAFFSSAFTFFSSRGRVQVHTIDITPVSIGNGSVSAYLGLPDDAAICNRSAGFTVIPPPPWWQVRGAGDVIVNGTVRSQIPRLCTAGEPGGTCRDELIVEDSNSGLPGILIHPAGVTPVLRLNQLSGGNPNIGRPTTKGGAGPSWVAQTTVNNVYSYVFFESLASGKTFYEITDGDMRNQDLAPADTPPYQDTDGYAWVRKIGDLLIGNDPGGAPLNVGNRKVIVFVDGNLTIDGEVNIGNNGFAMFIVSGNILVSPSVGAPNNSSTTPNVSGIYWTDGQFATGTTGLSDDKRINFYGSFAARGTGYTDAFLLQRDLTDVENPLIPAETFTFAPEYQVRFPQTLSDKHLVWREVAP